MREGVQGEAHLKGFPTAKMGKGCWEGLGGEGMAVGRVCGMFCMRRRQTIGAKERGTRQIRMS